MPKNDIRITQETMSSLSLKKMLNDTTQCNLNNFLDVQLDSKACSTLNVKKSKKNQKSSKNLRVKEEHVYKVSNSIFGGAKSKNTLESVNKSKNRPKSDVKLEEKSEKCRLKDEINKFNDNSRKGLEIDLKQLKRKIIDEENVDFMPKKAKKLLNRELTPHEEEFDDFCEDDLKTAKKSFAIFQPAQKNTNSTPLLYSTSNINKSNNTIVKNKKKTALKRNKMTGDFFDNKHVKKSPEKLKKNRIIVDSESSDISITSSEDKNSAKKIIKRAKIDFIEKSIENCCFVDKKSSLVIDDIKKCKNTSKNTPKVASVFINAFPKPKIDEKILESRRNFLNATSLGINQRKNENATLENYNFEPFPTFSHTQQKTNSLLWRLSPINQHTASLIQQNELNKLNKKKLNYKLNFGEFTITKSCNIENNKITRVNNKNTANILRDIKQKNPNFNVYKIYKRLKEKNKHPKNANLINNDEFLNDNSSVINNKNDNYLLWTDKYKPSIAEDIIGNRTATYNLLKFLKNQNNVKNHSQNNLSSSSDKDTPIKNRVILITGPYGTGKSSSIHAICCQLNINILELNASKKRTGKILIQTLQEATQSKQIKQRSNCVLVLEDIDVIFQQDDGFIAALTHLLHTTKRPIILTYTSNENNNKIRKFTQEYPVVKFAKLPENIIDVYLQLVCLVEGVQVGDGCLKRVIEGCKGDLRRGLLQMQFLVDSCVNKDILLPKIDDFVVQDSVAKFPRVLIDGFNFMDFNQRVILYTAKNFGLISEFYDCLSIGDLLRCRFDLLQLINWRCQMILSDSVCLEHSNDYFTAERDHFGDLAHFLAADSFSRLNINVDNIADDKKWDFNINNQRACQDAFLKQLPLNVRLDRRSFGLDYYPMLITVSKIERGWMMNNTKRGNRFNSCLRRYLGLGFNNSQMECLYSSFGNVFFD